VPEFRFTFAPSRRPSFNTRWFPLVSDVRADRAEVSASNFSPYHNWFCIDVVLYVWEPPKFGKPGRWAGVDPQSSASGLHIPGLTDPGRRACGHVELLCPARLPVWECRWCHVVHDELSAAARCAADGWAARCRANEEAVRRWYTANPPR
jgi:hypothetical protein